MDFQIANKNKISICQKIISHLRSKGLSDGEILNNYISCYWCIKNAENGGSLCCDNCIFDNTK